MNPLVSVIIVNYNTADMIVRCLNAVQEGVKEVIVVDNASRDSSVKVITDNFPGVRLISNTQNLGFACANNQAIPLCTGDYIYFLNPDTELKSDAVQHMMKFMESHPDVGLAGTHTVYPDDSHQISVHMRYPGEKHTKDELAGLKGDIAWVKGASMIARRDVIDEVGGFDESFFLYGEDIDLCLSIRKKGWLIGYIPDATVVHWRGQSERTNTPAAVWKKKFDAEMIFYRKHYSPECIRAIRRANLMKAYWRIFTLKLALPFYADKTNGLNKLGKYQAAAEVFGAD